MNRIVYLIASHTSPEQVIRLVQTIRLQSPDSYILIHHDYSRSHLERSAFQQISHLHILEDYVSASWGEFSLVEMELRCMNWLLTNSIQFDWLIFLSGQDYLIKPVSEIEKFLRSSEYDGFMEYFLATQPPLRASTEDCLSWQEDTGFKRFFYHYYKLPLPTILNGVFFRLRQILHPIQSFMTFSIDRNGIKLGIRCLSTPFNSTFQCYAGSQWHTLSYRCVQYIHEFVQQHPAFVAHYRKTLIPDESFFQTILLNNAELKILNNNKRYVIWNKSKPAILSMRDFDRLMASDHHIARKFDFNIDTQIIDRLDQQINSKSERSYLSI